LCQSIKGALAGGTVQVTFNETSQFCCLVPLEYANIPGGTDGFVFSATDVSGTTSGPLTTTASNDLLLAFVVVGSNDYLAPGSGWTARVNTPLNNYVVMDQVGVTPGSYTATATTTAATFAATMLVAFQNVAPVPATITKEV
jgi:hypothetical protein